MDFVTVLGAVSQFHEKLDELLSTATANKAVLAKLQKVLDIVVDQLEDFSNKYPSNRQQKGSGPPGLTIIIQL